MQKEWEKGLAKAKVDLLLKAWMLSMPLNSTHL